MPIKYGLNSQKGGPHTPGTFLLSSIIDSGWSYDAHLFVYLQENPDAKLEDLEKPGVDEEPQQVLLR